MDDDHFLDTLAASGADGNLAFNMDDPNGPFSFLRGADLSGVSPAAPTNANSAAAGNNTSSNTTGAANANPPAVAAAGNPPPPAAQAKAAAPKAPASGYSSTSREVTEQISDAYDQIRSMEAFLGQVAGRSGDPTSVSRSLSGPPANREAPARTLAAAREQAALRARNREEVLARGQRTTSGDIARLRSYSQR